MPTSRLKILFLAILTGGTLEACSFGKLTQQGDSVLSAPAIPFVCDGKLSVIPGNIISVSTGENPSESRAFVFDIAREVIQEHGAQLGFDSCHHKLVIPKTPYKPGTIEHWPDKGAHITIALHNRTLNIRGEADNILQTMTRWQGHPLKMNFNMQDPLILLGNPENDEAVGAVYYLALKVDNRTVEDIQALREKMGLGPLGEDFIPHVTLAGIAPIDDDFKKFRDQWCAPYPKEGVPTPLKKLVRNPVTP